MPPLPEAPSVVRIGPVPSWARSSSWNARFHIDMIGKFWNYGFLSELPMLPETFETARLLLRPITVVDVDAIFDSYAQDEEVARYLIWRPHRSRSETRAYVDRCIATPSEVERTYMLVVRADNVVQGAFALRRVNQRRTRTPRGFLYYPLIRHSESLHGGSPFGGDRDPTSDANLQAS
jgi:RimJ/RimL family protein N-acetyltransferase